MNDSVVSDDESGIGVGIEAVTRALGAHGYSLEDIQRFARVTMTMLLERLSGFEVGLEEIYPAPSNIIMAICTCSSRREILRHLHVFLQTVATHITKCTHGGAKDSASVIKGYIERNFADEKLSSGTIAQELHFNSAYVSTLFSSNYGMNTRSRVNQVRIANAARLLDETEDKVSTIARKVGYESRPYFARSLKTSWEKRRLNTGRGKAYARKGQAQEKAEFHTGHQDRHGGVHRHLHIRGHHGRVHGGPDLRKRDGLHEDRRLLQPAAPSTR